MKLESSFLPLGSSLPPPLDRHSRVSFVVFPANAGAPVSVPACTRSECPPSEIIHTPFHHLIYFA